MRGLVAAVVIGSLGGLVAAAPAHAAPGRLQYTHESMGTIVTVWFWTDREADAAKAANDMFAEIDRLDREMTSWKPGSDVSNINDAAGEHPVKVSDETLAVLERALDISRRSGGVFDITVGGFRGLWKFDEDMDPACKAEDPSCVIPTPEQVNARLPLINWHNIVLDPKAKTVFLRKKGMRITLGGIAKGYSVDKCVALLEKRGFTDFMVQAGGDMYIKGSKGDRPWMVGIRDPRGPRDAMFAVAPIRDHSFSTSGDYERGFVKDGVRYHHILVPQTGYPAHASRSVTVRATDAFTADAWSKVMFIDGWKKGLEVIKANHLKDFDVVWVDDQNQIHTTPGIEKDLTIVKQPTPGP